MDLLMLSDLALTTRFWLRVGAMGKSMSVFLTAEIRVMMIEDLSTVR